MSDDQRIDRGGKPYTPQYKEDAKGVLRDQHGRVAPGVSLNKGNGPTGPKALAKYVRALIGQGGERLVETMVDILDGKGVTSNGVVSVVTTKNRIDAAHFLAERGFGKAVETINLNTGDVKDAGADLFEERSVEELLQRRALLLQLKELDGGNVN